MKSFRKPIAVALSASLCFAAPAMAQGVDNLVQLEILDGGKTAKGTYLGALRLDLKDGWKTYWRAPGDAGIPPQFDWSGSANIEDISITWPAPHVFDQNGLRSIGYEDQLVLPIEITPRNAKKPRATARRDGSGRLQGCLRSRASGFRPHRRCECRA